MLQTQHVEAVPRPAYARYVLFTLLAVYMIHHLDRLIISLLLEPIGREFQLTDTQRGLLAGLGYAVPFALAGLPLGMLIDRVHRVRLLATLLAIWSGLTALCALASGFWMLMLARIGIGAAESGGTPSNMSILADYFPAEQRGRAFGVYYMGPHLGTLVGFALAGIVANAYGWRAAFLLVGLPGLLLVAVLLLTIREPPRGGIASAGRMAPGDPSRAATRQPAPTLGRVLRKLWDTPAALHILIGSTLGNVVAAGLTTWLPAFMIRSHGLTVGEAGLAIGLATAPLGAAASLIGGALSDRLGGYRSPRAVRMLALALGGMVVVALVGLTTRSTALMVAAFALKTFAIVLTNGPSYAAVLSLMPASMQGVSAALLQVSSNVLGFGVGVTLLGKVSDALSPEFGVDALRYTMLAFSLIGVWGAFHFLLAARALRGPALDAGHAHG